MSKKTKKRTSETKPPEVSRPEYKKILHTLQVELVKLQRHFSTCNDKILVLLEGRDGAGKTGRSSASFST